MQIKGFNRILSFSLSLLVLTLLFPIWSKAQSFDIVGNKKRVSVPFRIIRNMVVVTMDINNKGPFNFILDTGVGIMLITEPKLADYIDIPSKRTIKIFGLNGESYEAFVTPPLNIDMRTVKSNNVGAAILKKDPFDLSNYAGIPIHGLLGYEFFSNLAVRFNFSDSTLTVSKPQYVRLLRKGERIPLTLQEKKPYINAMVKMPDGKKLDRKLLIDIGAGHPLSLENILGAGDLPENFITANLGVGLTGPITGYISRVTELTLGKYTLKNVLTSFPDQDHLKKNIDMVPRDGNMGIGILKRFTMIIDYANGALYLKKNIKFKDPFEHDMTGMEYYFDGKDFGHLIVGRVEPGSAADIIGLKPTDEITAINLKPIEKMPIDQIDNLFRSRDGRNLLLEVSHKGSETFQVLLTLKKRI